MADLYQTSRTNVVEHIKHIYEEGELDEQSTCRNFRQVRREGRRGVARNIPFYNLDMIISLGYRVKSSIAARFRRWATDRLKEYMIKGFIALAMESDQLDKRVILLAALLANSIYEAIGGRNLAECRAVLHIFASAPNALMLFLGQNSMEFGKCILYEYVFDQRNSCTYSPSFYFTN